MKAEFHIKDVENKIEPTQTIESCPDITSRDILETHDITIEEVAIDGICGVY